MIRKILTLDTNVLIYIIVKLQKIFKFYRIGSITNPFLFISLNANNAKTKQKYVYNFKGNEKYSEDFLSDHILC